MIKQILNKKSGRITAGALVFAVALSALIIAISGTLAAPDDNDINVTLTQPNTYTEIEKNNSRTIMVSGIVAYEVSDTSFAKAEFKDDAVRLTGLKAGAVSLAVSSSGGYIRNYTYQITDQNNISKYTIREKGEVTLAKAGNYKDSLVDVKEGTDNIKWRSLNTGVATVNQSNGRITAVSKGTAIILGEFIDKWGVGRDIHILVGVAVNLNGSKLGELIDLINKGEDILSKNPGQYDDNSLKDLQNAVSKGKDVLNNNNPPDNIVDGAIKDLTDAINNMKPKPGGGNIVKGPDDQHYRPVVNPPNVYEKVDENGNGKYPPEYIYNPDGKPGNGNNRPAYPDGNGIFWTEDPKGSNIWKPIDKDGKLDEKNAVWGGPDGKFGGGDDQKVDKFGDDYWVTLGQNVWRKVIKSKPTTLGPMTGGGPSENPEIEGVTPIKENNGKYYVGPIESDDGVYYYYGDSIDPARSNNKVMSTVDKKHDTDDKFYFTNGHMSTLDPKEIVDIIISPKTATVALGGKQLFTAQVIRRDGSIVPAGTSESEVIWGVLDPHHPDTLVNLHTGELYISPYEENMELVIMATCQFKLTVANFAKVTVTQNPNFVKYITVDPPSAVIEKGGSKKFAAEVHKNDNSIDKGGVKWSVEPAGSGTSIDDNGVLTIGAGETNATLKVTAASKTDPNVSSDANITVIPPVDNGRGIPGINDKKPGTIINIDGYEWVLVLKEYKTGAQRNVALLLLNNVLNPESAGIAYAETSNQWGGGSNHTNSNPAKLINHWYYALNSPMLKKYALKPGAGGYYGTWLNDNDPLVLAGTQTDHICFVPGKKDVFPALSTDLLMLKTPQNPASSTKLWWTSTPHEEPNTGKIYLYYLKSDGTWGFTHFHNATGFYTRPAVWVLAD